MYIVSLAPDYVRVPRSFFHDNNIFVVAAVTMGVNRMFSLQNCFRCRFMFTLCVWEGPNYGCQPLGVRIHCHICQKLKIVILKIVHLK